MKDNEPEFWDTAILDNWYLKNKKVLQVNPNTYIEMYDILFLNANVLKQRPLLILSSINRTICIMCEKKSQWNVFIPITAFFLNFLLNQLHEIRDLFHVFLTMLKSLYVFLYTNQA